MHLSSMSLGVLDWLISAITSLVGTVVGWVFDIVMGIANRAIFNAVKDTLFIVDWVQELFRRLSGLDKYWVTEGGFTVEKEGDILMDLMLNQTVLQVLLALSLVAVAMVIMATIIKIVQSEFTTEGSKNSKGSIIATAIKSLMHLVLIPVLCVGGVWLSNMLLQALDNATSLGGSQSMASQIFVSAATSANRARNNSLQSNVENWLQEQGLYVADNSEATAANVDMMFRQNMRFESTPPASVAGIVDQILTTIFTPHGIVTGGLAEIWFNRTASYQNIHFVTTFYDIGLMNMTIMIGSTIMSVIIMVTACFGLVMRLFKAVILFMVSPPIVAIAPLDKGNALSSWRKQFLSEVFTTYGSVLGMNLFFIVLPVINNINVFPDLGVYEGSVGTTAGGYGGSIYNDLAHLLFTLVGLLMLKDIIKIISGLSGGNDAVSSGGEMGKKVVKTGAKVATVAAGVMTGGAALAAKGALSLGAKMAAKKGAAALAKGAAKKKAGQTLAKNAKGGRLSHARLQKKIDSGGTLTEKERQLYDQTTPEAIAKMEEESQSLIKEGTTLEEEGTELTAQAEEKRTKATKTGHFAGRMLKGAGAKVLGWAGSTINGMFGTKFNDKETTAERREFSVNDGMAHQKVMDSEDEGMTIEDIFNPNRRAYNRKVSQQEREAAAEEEAGSSKVGGIRKKAVEAVGELKLDGLDATSLKVKSLELQDLANHSAEDEQTQQILRNIAQAIKDLAAIDDAGEREAALKSLHLDGASIASGSNEDLKKLTENHSMVEAKVEVLQKIQEVADGKEPITEERLKEIVTKLLADDKFKDKGIDPSKLIKEIQKSIKDILDKKAK